MIGYIRNGEENSSASDDKAMAKDQSVLFNQPLSTDSTLSFEA